MAESGVLVRGVLLTSPYSLDRVTGIGRFIHDLSSRLTSRGLHTSVCSPYAKAGESGLDRGITLRWRALSNVELTVRTVALLFRRRDEFDILHAQQAHLQSLAVALVGRIFGKPAVLTLHLRVPRPAGWIRRLVQEAVEILSTRVASSCVAVSAAVAESYEPRITTVIENGVDLSAFRPSEQARDRVRAQLGLQDEIAFIFAARWATAKGFDVLLRAASSPSLDSITYRLIILGERAADEPNLAEQIVHQERLPKVSWIGRVEALTDYLAAGDVLILPSRFEGMPLGFLEALASGLPVLASDLPVHRVIAERAGVGWIVPVGDSDALAKEMAEIARVGVSLAERKRAREAAERYFSLERMVDMYQALYRRLVASRAANN